MKLIPSGVTFSAAIIRSPSFSRSASSTMMIICPARTASTASSMRANGELDFLSESAGLLCRPCFVIPVPCCLIPEP
jgi:hypothetical protein